MQNFETAVIDAAQHAMVDMLKKGDWLKVGWENHIKVQQSFIQAAYASIDMQKVLEKVTSKLEDKVADAMVASLVTELGNDVKQIMCNTELREELRGVVRGRLRQLVANA